MNRRLSIVWLLTFLIALCALLEGNGLELAGGASIAHAEGAFRSHTMRAYHRSVRIGEVQAGRAQAHDLFSCQSNTAAELCYGPQQIQAAYGVQALFKTGITGRGRTIVIIDAFQSPTIKHDLALFDKVFKLKNPSLQILAPDGLAPFDSSNMDQIGWSAEITLDVEWAHVMAPEAMIKLVLAKSDQDTDILSAIRYAITRNVGDVISMSFGENETCTDPALASAEHRLFQAATKKGITLMAASGDMGAAQYSCSDGSPYVQEVSSPASDPLVSAVGGTTLAADAVTGVYSSEVAWSGSGGGVSTVYTLPNYQSGISGLSGGRGVPDVAYNADPASGVLVVWSSQLYGPDQLFIFGGTSAGAPQWSGLAALADQLAHKRLGFLNGGLYRIGQGAAYAKNFNDVVSGTNDFSTDDGNGGTITVNGYSAGIRWDPVTGWGTPRAAVLLPLLVKSVKSSDGTGL